MDSLHCIICSESRIFPNFHRFLKALIRNFWNILNAAENIWVWGLSVWGYHRTVTRHSSELSGVGCSKHSLKTLIHWCRISFTPAAKLLFGEKLSIGILKHEELNQLPKIQTWRGTEGVLHICCSQVLSEINWVWRYLVSSRGWRTTLAFWHLSQPILKLAQALFSLDMASLVCLCHFPNLKRVK